ncbi:tyrosine-protein kinase Drl isoform X1 [Diorhabda sublineata]|uniref:tyrosine-protein kinase Drl isoform X1 n=1 Tax=Diorhabda sublineata TaxID=1163346 RepID=UPI0024E195D8|nr:tyrosine-protein kinase Drl isoform X1 [Diorhabda sublineata]
MKFFLLSHKILLSSYFCVVCGYLNLYLSLPEVQRLLGLHAELFYIRKGVINDYALNFVVLIPSNVDSLHFTWETLTPGHQVHYSLQVYTSNPVALPPPKFNISDFGVIPNSVQTFQITLPCSGIVEAEVMITIKINITFSPENVTTLTFQRKKVCLELVKSTTYISMDSVPQFTNSANIFYIAVCCAILLILILAFVVISYYIKDNKTRRTTENGSGPTTSTTTFLAALPRSSVNASSYGSFRRMPSYSLIDERSKDLQDKVTELSVQRCRVRLSSIILEGTFGKIYHGSYTTEEGNEETVIVKTVTDHASEVQISLLLQEGMSMYALNHKNILSILRVSVEEHMAPFLLYPYKNYTNLKLFLQKCKVSSEGVHHTLTTQEVVDMALQIIQAMQYLHKKHLLHKDLAARNCLVDDKLNVLVADNALSRDLFPSDYHCLGDNENRPVKWLAIESLLHKSFSPSSDVWSFGVLLWELTTLAQQPYVEIDPFEMAAYLKDGYRLAQPINCPDELFAVMAYCWAMSAEERPNFTQLHVCLQEFYAQLTRYV